MRWMRIPVRIPMKASEQVMGITRMPERRGEASKAAWRKRGV